MDLLHIYIICNNMYIETLQPIPYGLQPYISSWAFPFLSHSPRISVALSTGIRSSPSTLIDATVSALENSESDGVPWFVVDTPWEALK